MSFNILQLQVAFFVKIAIVSSIIVLRIMSLDPLSSDCILYDLHFLICLRSTEPFFHFVATYKITPTLNYVKCDVLYSAPLNCLETGL